MEDIFHLTRFGIPKSLIEKLESESEGPWYDLGTEHYCAFITNQDGFVIGIIENHPTVSGGRCEGFVGWDAEYARPGKIWNLVKENPLTLSPSIKCTTCGSHGFIREGKWV